MKKVLCLTCVAAVLLATIIPVRGVAAPVIITDSISGDGAGLSNVSAIDVTCLGCITTPRIQDSAITSAKIASGAVGLAEVNSSQIQVRVQSCPPGQYLQSVGIDGSVTCGAPQGKYAKVLVVAQSGGDFSSIVAAVQSITDSSPTNPYLIKVMPGTYPLVENSSAALWSYIDIEGSGQGITKISRDNPCYGTISVPGSENEIRDITIEANYTSSGCGINAAVYGGGNLKIRNSTLTVNGNGGSAGHYGLFIPTRAYLENVTINGTMTSGSGILQGIGIDGYNTNPYPLTARNTTININSNKSSDVGIWCGQGSNTLDNVTIFMQGTGTDALSGQGNVRNSYIGGNVVNFNGNIDSSIITGTVSATTSNTNIGNSRIGAVAASSAHIKTINCYDNGFDGISNGMH